MKSIYLNQNHLWKYFLGWLIGQNEAPYFSFLPFCIPGKFLDIRTNFTLEPVSFFFQQVLSMFFMNPGIQLEAYCSNSIYSFEFKHKF